jgi:hypothetical protein
MSKHNGTPRRPEEVVLLGDHEDVWMAAILEALVRRGLFTVEEIATEDFGMALRPFDDGEVELVFEPKPIPVVLKVVVEVGERDSIVLIALLRAYDDEELCRKDVPRSGWMSTHDLVRLC